MTDRAAFGWATAAVIGWGAMLAVGVIAGRDVCRLPVAVGGVVLLLVVGGAGAVVIWRHRRARSDPPHRSLTVVALKVGMLFTAGMAVILAMVGLGPCL